AAPHFRRSSANLGSGPDRSAKDLTGVPVDHLAADEVVDQALNKDHHFLAADHDARGVAASIARLECVIQDAPSVLIEHSSVFAEQEQARIVQVEQVVLLG